MLKKLSIATAIIGLFAQMGFSQIIVGPYTGITQLTNITSTCTPIVNTVLGDTDFATNSAVEIPMGTAFTGTWADGLARTDGPGPEILCVSVHTEEWWDVQLLLSDASFTPAVNADMATIADMITLDFWDCTGTLYTDFFYDRRVIALDFSSFVIPPGLTVVGARFTLTGDNAANPDPIGMLIIGGLTDNGPTADNNGPICQDDTLKLFCDLDSVAYSWTGPAGFTSSVQNPVIPHATMANAGIYTCIVTDSPEIDTAYTTVVINPLPTATFVLPIACDQHGYTYNITGANDTITNYHWDFGDVILSDSSLLANPFYMYFASGPHHITLDLTSDEGCKATIDTNIVVHENPTATLSDLHIICAGSSATFDPTVTADTTVSYAWTFSLGSPNVSTDSVPTINFPTSGLSDVGLTVTTAAGCSVTANYIVNVSLGFNPDFGIYPICISRFTFDPLPNWTDSAWVIDWNMGDGTVLNDKDTAYFNHLYTAPGNYNVTMIVTNTYGCIDSVTHAVEVKDTITVNLPNVLYQESTINNNTVDFEHIKPGFNLCINYTYTIFDRWGTLVYEATNDPLNPDLYCGGCFKGKTQNGNLLSPGVYYYVMKGNFHILQSGFITIF
jgi:PKD repeat protein